MRHTLRALCLSKKLLMVLLLFAAIPLQKLWAAETYYQGVRLKQPNSVSKVYQIGTREELLWWAVNDQNKSIRLTANINVQGDKNLLNDDGKTLRLSSSEIVVWPKIYYEYAEPTIDGNGHTISGIYQNGGYGKVGSKLGESEAYDWVGFISYSRPELTIKNLTIADSYIKGKVAGGFMSQKSKNSTASDCAHIENCSFRGAVYGTKYAGGFFGWYRTDGQDVKFYRCFNYGYVQAGVAGGTDAETAAGGLVGYLDIKHTAFTKAHTYFNRCVNFGNVANMNPGANVGGIVGLVWDNNNGQREWRFCFNFGDVTKYDKAKKKLAGSGIIGNYTHTNGKSEPKVLSCGNARKSDTGSFLDSLYWNVEGKSFVVQGFKANMPEKVYSSLKEDTSGNTWWNNNYGWASAAIIITTILIVGTSVLGALIGTGAISLGAGSAFAAFLEAINFTAVTDAIFVTLTSWGIFSQAVSVALAMVITLGLPLSVIFGGSTAAIGAAYNAFRDKIEAPNLMANTSLVYNDNDVRTANFAYDCNLAMRADSIGGEKNTDKTILFEQHIDMNDTTQNARVPSIITDYSDSNPNLLHYGYNQCDPLARVSNETGLLAAPLAHTFNSNGTCSVCGLRLEPLVPVTKKDGDKDVVVDYYPIKNQQQLDFLAAVFNGEKGFEEYYKLYAGATFKLENDITYGTDAIWEPIGSYTKYEDGLDETTTWHKFRGTFDGQGHTISGLKTDENTNYAGLFGVVTYGSMIRNVNLINCGFKGNVAGSIAGQIESKDFDAKAGFGPVAVDRVTVDSSVVVTTTSSDANAYAGGFFGVMKPNLYKDSQLTVSNCYSNATVVNGNENGKGKQVGGFIGCYNPDVEFKDIKYLDVSPIFKNCYFGGSYISANVDYVGTIVKNKFEYDYPGTDLHSSRFVDCYCVGTSNGQFDDANSSSSYVYRDYIKTGRLAYDLMLKTKANGKYYYTQKGDYPVFATSTDVPSLCKVTIYNSDNSETVGDTILVKDGPKLQVPFTYAGVTFTKATIAGWANTNKSDTPTEKATTENDFSMLTAKPWTRYALYATAEGASPTIDIYKAYELRSVPTIAGKEQTNIMTDLYLGGTDAVTLKAAPQVIDGKYHTIAATGALISETTAQTTPVEIRNLRFAGPALTTDLAKTDASRTVKLTNVILLGSEAFSKNGSDNYSDGTVFSNAVSVATDSTSIKFYQGSKGSYGIQSFSTDATEASKKATYANILSYMLQHNMLDAFGLRLDKTEGKAAGKIGFANDASKRIYRAALYNQATGAQCGEVLMNYDGQRVYKINGQSVSEMTEGVPAGYFAVLPVTKAELGNSFNSLATNAITKDAQAKVIRLVDSETTGFAYPSCFPGSDNDASSIILTADRAEYVRKVYRDGLHESLYLPFSFTSLEFDESEITGDDEIDIAFIDVEEGDGITKDGTAFNLTNLSSYYEKKAEESVDPAEAETDEEQDSWFIAGVPYFLNVKCAERTDETTEVTFVGSEVGFLREPLNPGLTEPLYGSFSNTAASTVANGKKVFVLGAFNDQATGNKIEKFVSVKDTYKLSAFRSYLATNISAEALKLVFDKTGGTTGINVVKGNAIIDGKAYDITGRRINAANAHGVYIKNGKKIINLRK